MNVIPISASAGITGFERPAAEYSQLPIDIDELLIEHPSATFIGRACGESMQGVGIFDGDLLIVDRHVQVENQDVIVANYTVELVKKNFNVEVERTIRELNGQVCKKWGQVRADKHQIYSTRSVGERIVDIQSLRQALSKHAGIAARKARQQGSLCKVFLCFAGNSPFDEHPQSFRFIHRFAYSTADTQQLTKVACDAAEQLFKNGVPQSNLYP